MTTQKLEQAAILIEEAKAILKTDYRDLAEACEILLEEIDATVDYEDERAAWETQ